MLDIFELLHIINLIKLERLFDGSPLQKLLDCSRARKTGLILRMKRQRRSVDERNLMKRLSKSEDRRVELDNLLGALVLQTIPYIQLVVFTERHRKSSRMYRDHSFIPQKFDLAQKWFLLKRIRGIFLLSEFCLEAELPL